MGHPWEQRKLGDYGKKFYSGGTPSTKESQFWDGNIPWIQSSDLTEGCLFGLQIRKFITEQAIDKSAAKKIPADSIAIVTRVGVGKLAYIPFTYSTSQDFLSIADLTVDPYFGVYSIYSKLSNNKQVQGTAIKGITSSEVKSFNMQVPAENEQRRIGELFQQLDNLITLHQRKLDLLKEKKKGLLQKMFPKPGENKPELRFSGFTDPWKQRKISELFKITRGNVLAANKTEAFKSNEDPYPVYSSQTKNNGLMGYYKDYLYENAITWTTDGANAGTVNYRSGKFYCTNVCGVLLAKEIQPCLMVAERLNSVTKDYVSYVGNPKLMNNVMADININLPWQEEERQKMSDLFAMVDDLITLHQRKLDLLKEKKKGLLQKMFPKPGQQEPELRFSEFR